MKSKRPIKKERRQRGRNTRIGKIVSAVIAVMLVVAMAVGLLPENKGRVYAAEPVTDGQTMLDYSWSLGDVNSTQYNGRVWTDKSVSKTDVTFGGGDAGSVTVPIGTGDDASDFLVTYSALATSQKVSGESNVPVDVVFVIDLSGSMSNDESYMNNRQKRIQNLVTALNASINELMDMNSENRIGVVGYSSTATTILPLDHYTPNGNSQNIFSYSDQNTRLSWNARNSSNRQVSDDISVTGGTNTQMGIYQGMNMLASESNTTVTVGGQEMKRVPSVIVMADGAATYSSDSTQWWNPSNNSNDGPGSRAYYGNGMKAMMTASYMKQAINRNYNVEDTSSSYAAKVYTIGIGTADLGGDDEDLANITLNPKDHWNDNNNMANSIRNAWNGVESQFPWGNDQEGYISNNGTGTPEINVGRAENGWFGTNYYDDWYELTHPQQYDINEVGLQYNDAYYDAITADDVNEIFDDIVSSIAINTPQVPTKIEGNDPVSSGYITYTDVIGDYMEVDSVKELIWAGKEFKNPSVSGEGTADVTYTFEGEINNPAYENAQNANQIQITVHTDTAADGTKTQTMTVKIPATAIPLRVNTVELGENEQGETTVESNTSNNAYPLRLVYGVSLQDGINLDTLEGVSEGYITKNTDENGKVNFYSNKYSGNTQGEGDAAKTVGDAKVEFTPANENPYYFLQEDTPIYMNQTGDQRVAQDQFNENGTYWVPVTYYEGNNVVNTRVERTGASMANYIQYERSDNYPGTSYAYITAGAPRLGNIEQFIQDKETNTTGTAATSFYPTFEGTDVHDGKFVVYLGNNGKLQIDAPASLIIGKNVTADEGLTAPDATFTFEITSDDKAGQKVSAVKTTGTGDSASTENAEVWFNDQGVATVELTADQTIELKGMAGADYSIKEVNIAGGFALSNVEGADTTSGSGNDTVASGEVNTDATDETVTFTNNYSVTPATSTGLNIPLSGSKTIDGRDFQTGDEFTFTIAAAQATSDAPLPQKDGADVISVTINPTSGETADFAFDGEITFTKPGEYRYIIRETQGELAGVDYDTAVFRLNVVIVDNGDGTLRLADVDEIDDLTTEDGMAGDRLGYTANPMVQEYNGGVMQSAPNNAVQFDNNYNADAATAAIQGTKLLNKTNTDYQLKDGDFKFTIAALGSTEEAKDSYTADDFATDDSQPMPVDEQGQLLTETINIANGNVQFSFAQNVFTQDMVGKTFGYQITEALGEAPDNTTMDSNISRIVWVTVGDDGQGHVTTTVGPNDGQSGTPNNFTFTNSYEPTSTTIGAGDKAGITVQKTFEGHEWTEDYTFEYTIKNTDAPDGVTAPMPEKDTIEIGNPESGKVNTNVFGSMTFEQEGTYTYEITETKGNHGGVTYDEHVATVTVTVTEDEAAGTLSAQVVYDNRAALNDSDKKVNDAAAFTNTYNATFDTDTTVNLSGTKNLTVGANSDRTLEENQFFAVITPLDGAPYGDKVISPGSSSYTVGNAADDKADDGTFSGAFNGLLSNVTFSLSDLDGAASKDFVYLISEQQSGVTGVTYDNAVYQVTITVTDDGNGNLSAGSPVIVKGTMQDDAFAADDDQSGVNGVVFNNSYTPNPSDAVAAQTLKKVLSGNREQELQAGEFEFKIELSDGDASGVTLPNPATVTNDADGNINFGNITFTKAGIYKIKATEVVPGDAVDNGDGTYTLNHITYDTHTIETTFTVTDQNGKLTVNRTGTNGSTTFTNTYKPDETTTTDDTSVDTNILVTKEVTGAPATEAFTFSLNLADGQDGSNVFEGTGDDKKAFDGVEVTTSKDIAAGATETKAFAGVTFTAAGDYKFVIDETTTTNKAGWTYADKTEEITVHVADQNGTLVITSIDNNDPTFTNSYKANEVTIGGQSGNAGITVQKTLSGRNWQSGDKFTFTLTAVDGAPMPAGEGASVTITEKTDVSKSAVFGAITYTEEGEYHYTVAEKKDSLAGITYDAHTANVTVKVTDTDYDGKLEADVIYDNSSAVSEADKAVKNAAAFTNTYKPEEVTIGGDAGNGIKVQKTLKGRDWAEDEAYSFEIKNTSTPDGVEAPMPEETVIQISGPESGIVNTAMFGEMTFTQAGTYVYEISEQSGDSTEMIYDSHVATVTVSVFEAQHDIKGPDGEVIHEAGTLWSQVQYDNSGAGVDSDGTEDNHFGSKDDQNVTDAAAFTNTQNVEGTVNLIGTKILKGREFQEGDKFTFAVEAEDNAPMPDEVDKDGNITIAPSKGSKADINFGDIKFTEAGEYVYHITEQKGNASGMTYDTARRDIIITVTDDGTGALTAEITTGADQLTWTNSWTFQEGAAFSLDGTKKLTGKALMNSQFTFLVEPQNDAPMGSTLPANFNGDATQNGDGSWTAPITLLNNITYTKPGEYLYIITEVNDGQPGITYDDTQYRVTVTVKQDGTTESKIEKSNDGGTTWVSGIKDITFENSYKTDDGPATLDGAAYLAGTKTLSGRDWLDTDSFTFLLKAGDEATQNAVDKKKVNLPEEMEVVEGAYSDGAEVPFSFGDITFTEAGEYTFKISEQQPGTDGFVGNTDGMTYDDHEYIITVKVADNGKGKLAAEVTKTTGDSNWKNVYKSGGDENPGILSGEENLKVTKVIDGREWQEGDAFTFVLTGGDDVTKKAIEDNKVELPENASGIEIAYDAKNPDTEHTGAFGDIKFTEPGNYVFHISEQVLDEEDKIGGMTYDETVRVIEVSVTDNNDGTLAVESVVTSPDEGLTFTNTYKPGGDVPVDPDKDTQADISLKKILEGKKWDGDEFTFELTAKNGTAADGTMIQPEDMPMPEGEGNIATVDGPDEEDGNTASIDFGEITYNAAGTYVYEVREKAGDNDGMTYSGNIATVTVNVSDDLHGGYTATVTIENGTFTNTYHTDLIYDDPDVTTDGLNVVKKLKGHDMTAGQFEFTLTAADEASAKKAGIEDGLTKTFTNSTATHDEEGVSTDTMYPLSGMEFTQEDSGNTYSYTISEKNAGVKGYTYDSDEYTVTIKVSDDGKGTLTAETTVTNGEDYTVSETVTNHMNGSAAVKVPFTNTYNATGTLGGDGEGAVKINATKELTNRDQVAGEFKFNVTNSKEENGKPVTTGTNAADGTVTFDPIEYTTEGMLEDVANGIAVAGKTEDGNDTYTYQYTVAEDESSFDDGVTAIEASFQITVTVTDNNDGTLSIAVTYPEGSNDNLTFRNAYGAGEDGTAVLNIKGAKDLDVESGNNAPDIAGKYTFELSGSEGAPMPDNTTATNDAAGNVSFGDITYAMENVFGEAASDDSSVSEDQTAEPETPAADEAVDGNEGGSAEDTADVPADETDGTEAETADETGSDEAEVDAQSADEAVQPEAEQQDAGEATGDNIQTTFVEPAMTGNDGIAALSTVRQKTFTYTVTETGSVAGVTNDAEASKTFDVTVTDNGDGTLSVTTSEVPGGLFKFTNTYSVTPTDPTDPTNPDDSGEAAVTITKELAGRDMTEGEFSFVLKDANGETVSETKNAADGSVKFTGITFDTPGSYSYTISEVQGNAGGVTYDSTIYKATATVTDNSDGTLSAVWSVTDADGNAVDSIVFHNEYSYSGTTTVTLGATKALDGRAMEEGEFNFLLKDSDGEIVAKAANSKDGAVQFDELSFDKPGTYEYTISEEKGDDATITYDDTVYNVTVTVADSGEGYLTASVDFGGETPAFTNVYTAPEEPTEEPAKPADNSNKGETPKADKIQKEEPAKTTTVQTGDSSPIMMTVIVMAAALVAIIAAIVVMFRRRNGR